MGTRTKTAVEEFQERERLDAQIRMEHHLEKMVKAVQAQADLAKQESAAAKEEAAEAKRQSQINTWIAAAAVIVAVLAWLVPGEMVHSAICAFFQSH